MEMKETIETFEQTAKRPGQVGFRLTLTNPKSGNIVAQSKIHWMMLTDLEFLDTEAYIIPFLRCDIASELLNW